MPLRHRVHSGHELTATLQTLLTFSDNLTEGGAILWGFMVVNRASATRKVSVYLVPSGGAASESNVIYEENVPANSSTGVTGPFHENSLAFIQAVSDTANSDVGIRLTSSEEYQQ